MVKCTYATALQFLYLIYIHDMQDCQIRVRFCSSNETLFLISVFFVDILRQYQRRLLPIIMTSYI